MKCTPVCCCDRSLFCLVLLPNRLVAALLCCILAAVLRMICTKVLIISRESSLIVIKVTFRSDAREGALRE